MSCKTRIGVAVLIVVLLAPSAVASNESPGSDPSLWTAFVAWLAAGIDISAGVGENEDGFAAWLMGRIHIPGG